MDILKCSECANYRVKVGRPKKGKLFHSNNHARCILDKTDMEDCGSFKEADDFFCLMEQLVYLSKVKA